MNIRPRLWRGEYVYTFPRGTRVGEVVMALSPWMRKSDGRIKLRIKRNSPGASQWKFRLEGVVVTVLPPAGFTNAHEDDVTIETPVGVGVTQRCQ